MSCVLRTGAMMATDWTTSDDPASAALSAELEREFHVERALLPSGVAAAVRLRLSRPATPLLRCARALTGAVLLTAAGCVALAAGLVFRAEQPGLLVLRLAAGLSVTTLAVLLAFAAPRLARWQAETTARVTGRFVPAGPAQVLALRVASLLLLAGAAVMLSY